MYSFYIDENDIKKFMNMLLKEDTFDRFEVRNCTITSFVTFDVDCNIVNDMFSSTSRKFPLWGELRPYIYDIIKGRKKPRSMKIVLAISGEEAEKIHDNAQACFLNILYEQDGIAFVTGTSQKDFALDKTLENEWGDIIKEFFDKLGFTQITA